jgi:hypothetical protein
MSSINCEGLTEFEKSQSHKTNSKLNENKSGTVLARESYKNSAENLQEELARIGSLIRNFLEKTVAEAGENSQDFASLFISEAEANSIIQAVCCGSESCKVQELKSLYEAWAQRCGVQPWPLQKPGQPEQQQKKRQKKKQKN